MLCARAFRQLISVGHLTMIGPDGTRYECYGTDRPRAVIRIIDSAVSRPMMMNPQMAVGEAYMDGSLVLEEGTTLYDFLDLCLANAVALRRGAFRRFLSTAHDLRAAFRHWNPTRLARAKVARHYDLSGALFDLFLDGDRQYSCGYFLNRDDDLETAQWNKKLHIAAKLNLEDGDRVLDIGSGWGGLGLFLAGLGKSITVDGITLSHEQHAASNRRAEAAGLAERVRFHLKDYRELDQRYDRIVSVGMLEHVGPRHYREFYRKISQLLAPKGVALIHSVGVFRTPLPQNQWMEKYIFPGAYTPSLSQQFSEIERTDLFATDIEILRRHYAETLLAWRLNCARQRDRIEAMYDERFYRMWEFYLTGCEAAFRRGNLMVFQIQLSNELDQVPQTRDYIADFERRWRGRGATTLRQVSGDGMRDENGTPTAPDENHDHSRRA